MKIIKIIMIIVIITTAAMIIEAIILVAMKPITKPYFVIIPYYQPFFQIIAFPLIFNSKFEKPI